MRTVSAIPVVRDVRSPLDNAGQVSTDGRSALVQFKIAGEQDKAMGRVQSGCSSPATRSSRRSPSARC